MKLTTKELRTIIKEELDNVLKEAWGPPKKYSWKDVSKLDPEVQKALTDREQEVQDKQSEEAVDLKIAELEIAAQEAWDSSGQEGDINDSDYFNPVKFYTGPKGKEEDPAGRERDVLFLLSKTVSVIGVDQEEGQLSVENDILKWEHSYESDTREYGQAFHIWTTFFDEDRWQWSRPEENIDAKADYDDY